VRIGYRGESVKARSRLFSVGDAMRETRERQAASRRADSREESRRMPSTADYIAERGAVYAGSAPGRACVIWRGRGIGVTGGARHATRAYI